MPLGAIYLPLCAIYTQRESSTDLYDDVVLDRSPTVAAILLIGGKSRRMGHDKSQLIRLIGI